MRPDDLELLRVALRSMSVLDLLELLAVLRVELLGRGIGDAAEMLSRAVAALARESLSPEAPSDNGSRNPGDDGAAG